MRATSGLLSGLNPMVTVISKLLVICFVLFSAILATRAGQYFQDISNSLLFSMKWFYIAAVSAAVVFLLYLALSRYGHIRLGKDDEKPEFNFITWIAMLFSGGMGVGLIFWSVAEPMKHYASNPFTSPLSNDSATMAMQLTFFHWGLHPWSVFIIVALALSYFSYRKGLPLTLRSILYPIIGERIYGPIGHVVDIITVVVTAFGISQTLGMGVIQINAGLNQAFGMHIGMGMQLLIILLVCTLAIVSVMAGIGRGIRRLAEWNMVFSLLMMAIVLLLGPTRYIFNSLLEGTGDYIQNIVGMSLWSDAQADSGWQNTWTAYYWPWWMTWAPFVGMFIARISRGRTVRELIVGALIVPTIITFIWIAVFGGTALKIEQQVRGQQTVSQVQTQAAGGQLAAVNAAIPFSGGPILEATRQDTTRALFALFNNLPHATIGAILSIMACLLLALHCVICADSGMLVLCILNAVGHTEPPPAIRVLWGVLLALIASVLLYAGGLEAMQTASIIAGFPVSIIIVLTMFTLFKAIRREPLAWSMLPAHVHPAPEMLDGPVAPLSGLKAVLMDKKKD